MRTTKHQSKTEMAEPNRKPKIILEKGLVRSKKISDIHRYDGYAILRLDTSTYIAIADKKLCIDAERSKTKIFLKGDNVLTINFGENEKGERLFVNSKACEDRNVLVLREFPKYADSLNFKSSGEMDFQIFKYGTVYYGNKNRKCYMIHPCKENENVELWVVDGLYPIKTAVELAAEQNGKDNLKPPPPPSQPPMPNSPVTGREFLYGYPQWMPSIVFEFQFPQEEDPLIRAGCTNGPMDSTQVYGMSQRSVQQQGPQQQLQPQLPYLQQQQASQPGSIFNSQPLPPLAPPPPLPLSYLSSPTTSQQGDPTRPMYQSCMPCLLH